MSSALTEDQLELLRSLPLERNGALGTSELSLALPTSLYFAEKQREDKTGISYTLRRTKQADTLIATIDQQTQLAREDERRRILENFRVDPAVAIVMLEAAAATTPDRGSK